MKALVTGASGFTGSHLVKALERQGHQVVALVRKTSDLSRLSGSQAQLVYGDITDRSALESAMSGVEWLFHVAAYVELGIVDAAKMQQINVEGTRAVLETAAQNPSLIKLVYCSTIGVYGDTGGQVIDEQFQRQQVGFSSAYDSTKYEAQQLVDQVAAQGLPVVSLMPSGIFGADDPHFGPVLQAFLRGKLKVWAGGERITGIVHVDDLVAAMLLAAEQASPGSHYIISTGDMTTRAMFEFFSRETGIPAPWEAPKRVVQLAGNLLDPLGRLLGWQPPISRERVHYIYERCVRVDGSKARRELGWQPRSVQQTLRDSLSQPQR
jgi:nucleoside-diphosphate-sugar epimerase